MSIFDEYKDFDTLALDFETTLDPGEARRMELFSVAGKKGNKKSAGAYNREQFLEFWGANKHKKFVFHNAKFDLMVMKAEGFDIDAVDYEDTLIMAHLLDETARKGLKDLRVSVLGKESRDKWKDVDKEDDDAYKAYAKEDAIDTIDLYEKFKDEIPREELELVYDLEKAVIFPVIDMEYYGSKIDLSLIGRQREFLVKEISRIYNEIKQEAGYEVNLRSSKQLQELFFDVLKYPPRKEWQIKTGYSINESVLTYIAGDRGAGAAGQIAIRMLNHRKYAKILSAFVDGLAEKADSRGYVYPSFNALGTATGRFSASQPNLQQIPRDEFVKGDIETHIRSLFICEDDELLITADYSQIELRMMAELSKDRNMCKTFKEGVDIHQRTADLIGCDRTHAKSLNFGIGYGMGPGAFAATTGLSFKAAQDYIFKFWQEYSGLEHFMQKMIKEAQRYGYVRTISGRKRRFYGAYDDHAARQTMNTVIQGSAADLIKGAMIKAYSWLDHSKARFSMQVHDELSLVAKKEYAEEAKEILKYCMEHSVKASIPLSTDPRIGRRWSENK